VKQSKFASGKPGVFAVANTNENGAISPILLS